MLHFYSTEGIFEPGFLKIYTVKLIYTVRLKLFGHRSTKGQDL